VSFPVVSFPASLLAGMDYVYSFSKEKTSASLYGSNKEKRIIDVSATEDAVTTQIA
jgi:hypothetical protein